MSAAAANSSVTGPALALAVVFAGLAVWPWLAPGEPPAELHAAGRSATAQASAAPVSRDPGALSAVLARPLFSPSRRPPAEAEAAPPAPLQEPARAVWRVEGVIDAGGTRRAILRREGAAAGIHAAEGDTVEGWTLRSISADRVILVSPAGETILPAR